MALVGDASTRTDTAGTSFNAAASASVIANVDGTAASVSTAISAIANGTVAGLTPGLGLIKAQEAAVLAVTASEKALATSNPTLDADKNGTVTAGEISGAKGAADQLRIDAFKNVNGTAGTVTSTVTAKATLADLTTATAAAKAIAVAATGGTALVSAYDTAVINQTAAKGDATAIAATAAVKASAIAGFDPAATTTVTYAALATASGLAAGDINSSAKVFAALTGTSIDASHRTALVAEINKAGATGAALVAAADKQVVTDKADLAVTNATTNLNALKTGAAGAEVTVGTNYITAVGNQKVQADVVAKVDAADVQVAAIKVVVDNYALLTKAAGDAGTAINNFDIAQTKTTMHDVSTSSLTGTADQADVFYFGSKVTTTDAAITNFGAGDSIVLSSALAYNAGALTTGNSTALEFFLVKSPGGVQIVVETAAYGNASTVTVVAN